MRGMNFIPPRVPKDMPKKMRSYAYAVLFFTSLATSIIAANNNIPLFFAVVVFTFFVAILLFGFDKMIRSTDRYWRYAGMWLFALTASAAFCALIAMGILIFTGQWRDLFVSKGAAKPPQANVARTDTGTIWLSVQALDRSDWVLVAKVSRLVGSKEAETSTQSFGLVLAPREIPLRGLAEATAYRIVLTAEHWFFGPLGTPPAVLANRTNVLSRPVPVNGIVLNRPGVWRAFYSGPLTLEDHATSALGQVTYAGAGWRDWTYKGAVVDGLPNGEGSLESGLQTDGAHCPLDASVCEGVCPNASFVAGKLVSADGCTLLLQSANWWRPEGEQSEPLRGIAEYKGQLAAGMTLAVGPFLAGPQGRGTLLARYLEGTSHSPQNAADTIVEGEWRASKLDGRGRAQLPGMEVRDGIFRAGQLVTGIALNVPQGSVGRESTHYQEKKRSGIGILLAERDFILSDAGGSMPSGEHIRGQIYDSAFSLSMPSPSVDHTSRSSENISALDCGARYAFGLDGSLAQGIPAKRWITRSSFEGRDTAGTHVVTLERSQVQFRVTKARGSLPKLFVHLNNSVASQNALVIDNETFDLPASGEQPAAAMVLAKACYGKALKNLATGFEEDIKGLCPLLVLMLARSYACGVIATPSVP
jgi:hypothetical protein